MKIRIIETPFKPATRDSVCSHLEPIVNILESNGCMFDWVTGIIPDKAAGSILLSETEIKFDVIEKYFDIPSFINIDPSRNLVFCKKCWCAIEKKQLGKVFNSSVQPKY